MINLVTEDENLVLEAALAEVKGVCVELHIT